MALSRTRRGKAGVDYWPGFVDALSTMLLTFVFLVSVFMLAQFFLTRDVAGKDAALQRLNRQIEELTALLALEQTDRSQAQTSLSSLAATLDATRRENDQLSGALATGMGATDSLSAEKKLSAQAQARIELLNQQITALRRQLAAIEQALQTSEARDKDAQARIADLGQRLNVALAQKVQELARYRSDFFGRLREILGNRQDMRVVGDRFVLDSEVFFTTGQAVLSDRAPAELDRIASAIVELERQIPPQIPWTIRVDGHTDKRPIQSPQYRSNWDLSAARAISVAQYLISRGVSPNRLMAAGLAEFQPIDLAENEEAYRRNRRIELRLTDR